LTEKASPRHLVIAALFGLFAAMMPAALALAPNAASPVAIVVPPWAEPGEAVRIVAAVNGTVVGATRGGSIAIARFAAEDFVTRLYQSGALLVIDAAAVTACFTIERDHSPNATRTPI
jgi:hypothetical protein